MDFQSIALPTELPHLPSAVDPFAKSERKDMGFSIFSKSDKEFLKKNHLMGRFQKGCLSLCFNALSTDYE